MCVYLREQLAGTSTMQVLGDDLRSSDMAASSFPRVGKYNPSISPISTLERVLSIGYKAK